MYLKKIVCENMGPISVADITPGFHPNGNPKPLVIVGKNGTGKSILISNIVDSFFEFGNQAYGDITKKTGLSNLYFKIAANNQIRLGKNSMICHLQYEFDGNSSLFYNYYQDYTDKNRVPDKPNDIHYFNDHYNSGKDYYIRDNKKFTKDERMFRKVFDECVLVYFPPERFFIPYWMGTAYSTSHNYGHIELQSRFSNELNKSIIVYNPTEENTRWIIDVLVDAKASLVFSSDKNMKTDDSYEKLLSNDKSKKNIENVLSSIMDRDVVIHLGERNTGKTRLMISSVQDQALVAPTIDALSTGQILLLNIFMTIIRYADRNNLSKSVSLEEITGIVVIDEIELHLHSGFQGRVLPRLIQMFPKVQFIITSHSPLFLLGMQSVFSDDGFDIVEMPDGKPISAESFSEFKKAFSTIAETQMFHNEIDAIMRNIHSNEKALVITEGPSDWKHMKRAWNKLKDNPRYAPLVDKFEFLEYEPANRDCPATIKMDMGGTKLKNMLEMCVNIPNRRKLIFIADRDVPDIVQRFTDNGSFKHHMLGKFDTNVYSFVIPLPNHRNQDNICIEHYYTDEEIRTPMVTGNATRHIFFGSDFNDNGFGVAPYSDYYCNKAGLCGPNKNKIIDGGNDVHVTLLSQRGEGPNCTLSKIAFAEAILNEEGVFSKISSESFSLIFDVLLEIIAPGSNKSTETTGSVSEGSETPR